MSGRLVIFILLAATVFAAAYTVAQLDLFGLRNRRGRSSFVSGVLLVIVALVWQVVRLGPNYADLFVPSAYLIADVLQLAALVVGMLLCSVGIVRHEQGWSDEGNELQKREQKLGMLENLQHDARQPYQLLELLDIALREMAGHTPGTCGAIFLANRSRRQFVLTASLGLVKDEIAALEHYPLERNIVSQAVEMGEPIIASGFDFVSRSGETKPSRFRSVLVLPLIAGMEKIGGLALFSDEMHRFDRNDARYLTPVAEWLAERIRGTRLGRELTLLRADRDRLHTQLQSLHDRVGAAVASLAAPDPLGAFCRALAGSFDSTDVHLCSIRSGRFEFLAHSASLGELSESYKTALIEAIDRHKPLLINQEATDETGRDRIVAATLVMSLGGDHAPEAILFRRDSSGIAVDEPSLRTLEVIARLAALAVDFVQAERRALSQRTGFERIMHLLNPDSSGTAISPDAFVGVLAPAFPEGTAILIMHQGQDTRWRVREAVQVNERSVSGLAINQGEGGIGRAASETGCVSTAGRAEVTKALEEYQPANRQTLTRLFGAQLEQPFMAVCPLRITGGTELVVLASSRITERDGEEYGRLLTLACGLYGFRTLIDGRRAAPVPTSEPGTPDSSAPNVQTVLLQVLSPVRISGDLYMVGGRPREIHTQLRAAGPVTVSAKVLQQLFERVITQFSSLSTDDEVITLAAYEDQSHVYVDISRHRRFFPAVKSVAEFGVYRHVAEAPSGQPPDAFLAPLSGGDAWYAADGGSEAPTYLSFKFPRRGITGSPPVRPAVHNRASVLVIDDQAVILDLVSAMCQTIGFIADVARSGEVGLRLAEEREYALVLVDLAMPGLSGLEVARELHVRRPLLPIVLMTGWEASLDRTALSDAGITDVLYKPFRIEQLNDLLRSAARA
jgi:CheY-like chemotaxis protein/putative methionine-R-sulfoxide reductase with GAF domain